MTTALTPDFAEPLGLLPYKRAMAVSLAARPGWTYRQVAAALELSPQEALSEVRAGLAQLHAAIATNAASPRT